MSLPAELTSTAQPRLASEDGALFAPLNRRLRPARRLTFLVCPRKVSKRRAPDIRPCTALRCVTGSFAPSALRGSAYKGRPWPFTPFAASMPLNPLHTDSTLPPDGTVRPCITIDSVFEQSFGYRQLPIRRPSRGVAQQASRQDAEKAPLGHGWPIGACLWSSAGAREVERSETRMPGRVSFAYFSLHEQRKVRRPAGRDLRPAIEKVRVNLHRALNQLRGFITTKAPRALHS